MYRIISQIAVNVAYTDPADNKVALVHLIAWCCYRKNVAYFTDAYMCNSSSMYERKQSNVWTNDAYMCNSSSMYERKQSNVWTKLG